LQSDLFERLADDAWLECADVGGDIRQLRHAYQLACGARSLQAGDDILANSWNRISDSQWLCREPCDFEVTASEYGGR
jgi:hypothetical protein